MSPALVLTLPLAPNSNPRSFEVSASHASAQAAGLNAAVRLSHVFCSGCACGPRACIVCLVCQCLRPGRAHTMSMLPQVEAARIRELTQKRRDEREAKVCGRRWLAACHTCPLASPTRWHVCSSAPFERS